MAPVQLVAIRISTVNPPTTTRVRIAPQTAIRALMPPPVKLAQLALPAPPVTPVQLVMPVLAVTLVQLVMRVLAVIPVLLALSRSLTAPVTRCANLMSTVMSATTTSVQLAPQTAIHALMPPLVKLAQLAMPGLPVETVILVTRSTQLTNARLRRLEKHD
jgi:hypothetical protein